MQQTPEGIVYNVRDPRNDARAILYRSAAARIPPAVAPWLQMITYDQASSACFSAVLAKPVGVLPTPHVATGSRRSRCGKLPITVAVLGNQRPEKGYQFMPEVARSLLQSNANIRILCHNANPGMMRETQEDLHEIAAKNSRLIMDERLAGGEVWQEVLDASDLIILPYASPRSPFPIRPLRSRRSPMGFRWWYRQAPPWPVWCVRRRRNDVRSCRAIGDHRCDPACARPVRSIGHQRLCGFAIVGAASWPAESFRCHARA